MWPLHAVAMSVSKIRVSTQGIIPVQGLVKQGVVLAWRSQMPNSGYAAQLQICRVIPDIAKQGDLLKTFYSGLGERQIRVTQTPPIRLTTTRPRRIVMAIQNATLSASGSRQEDVKNRQIAHQAGKMPSVIRRCTVCAESATRRPRKKEPCAHVLPPCYASASRSACSRWPSRRWHMQAFQARPMYPAALRWLRSAAP